MLSVVITAWNEEKNLGRAISSVKTLADEIIVVDTQSTDHTVEVAKKSGAKVFHHKNTGIVEPVRNFSIAKAKGDWILLLDADEEITQSLAADIKKAIQDPKYDYYRLPRKNVIFTKWIKSAHWWPDYVYRLFKKDSISWDDTIHSIPLTRGQGHDFPISEDSSIIHHNYSSVFQYVDRLNRYTDYQAEYLKTTGHTFSWTDLVNKPISEFFTQYFANQGYREGLHGLVLSGLQAFSELVLYSKLWQDTGFVSHEVTSKQLQNQLNPKASEFNWWMYQSQIDSSSPLLKPLLKLARKFRL